MGTVYIYFKNTKNILDSRNGIREFFAEPMNPGGIPWQKGGFIRCIGETENHYAGVPLALTGEEGMDEDGRVFRASSCSPYIPNAKVAVKYLSSPRFKGIGPVSAARLVREAGYDLFHFAFSPDAAEIMKRCCRCGDETAERCLNELRRPILFRKLLAYIRRHGGAFEDAELIFKEYECESIRMIKKYPYRMMRYGLPVRTCDSISVENGGHRFDAERVQAFVRDIIRRADRNGDSYVTLRHLCCEIGTSRYGALGCVTPLHAAAACIRDEWFCFLTQEEGEYRVYERELYFAEKTAAARVARSILSAQTFPFKKVDIEEIEKTLGIRYAQKQKESFRLLEKSGAAILVGGPGMGKTTLEKGYILAFRQMFPQAKIALCAPTAAAAKRMREATGSHAETIHRMLEVRPTGTDTYTARDENSALPYDLIIADECSMIDTRLFTMLIRAQKPGSLLILVGDDGQLASVGSGNVLRDLITDTDIPVCKLDTYFRQDGNSVIAANGRKIRKGEINIETDDSFRVLRVKDGKRMQEAALQYMRDYYDRNNPGLCRLFTTPRKKRYMASTERLNELLQKEFGSSSGGTLRRGETVFRTGDPVVFTKNNYTGSAVYLNGDEGRITAIEHIPGKGDILIVKTDSGNLEIGGSDMANIEPAYATTVHRAQGAECETAIILFPKEPEVLLDRSVALVATTRAKKLNIVISEGNAMEKAIRTKRMQERKTGLRLRLREAFGRIG